MYLILRRMRSFWRDRRGATAIEYGLIMTLVVVAIIASITALGSTTSDLWNGISANVIQHGPR